MNRKMMIRFVAPILIVLTLSGMALAENAKAIAIIMAVKGEVDIKKGDAGWASATFGAVLDDGDKIRTADNGFLAIVFTDDKSQLKIRPGTEITLNGKRDEDFNISKRINLEIGELFADVTKQKGSLQVATPTSVASVKGTEFWIMVQIDGITQVMTLEGLIEFLSLETGQTVEVDAGTQALIDELGGITISQINPDDIPGMIEEMLDLKTIEVEFYDQDGNLKKLLLRYEEEEE
jgi:FecR protein